MSRTHRLTVAIVLLSQVGFLAGMIGLHEYRSHNWQKVRLQTEPVDPVSLFRGRYVRLGYAFDTLATRDNAWMSGVGQGTVPNSRASRGPSRRGS